MTIGRRRVGGRAVRALAIAAAGLAAGCDDGPTGTDRSAQRPPALCERAVAVSVIGSGDLPTFTWTPACGVTEVVVTREENGETVAIMWQVRIPETQPIGPSVRYSQLPSRGETVRAAQALVRGETYRVAVRTIVGGDLIAATGTTTFVF